VFSFASMTKMEKDMLNALGACLRPVENGCRND
jgi:hypothetical protein